jgi:hypothetical protein
MGLKELVGQVGEDVREFLEDSRQFGVEEALFQQHLKSRYPQVKLLTSDGIVIAEGLLTSLDNQSYWIRERAEHGYVSGGAQFREDTIIETKDGKRVTPEIFKELVEAKAGKGYLDKLEKKKDALMQLALQSSEISDETRERVAKAIEETRDRKA